MGAYLSQPVTEKEKYAGSSHTLHYGGASMQGWRRSMEDAHITSVNLGDNANTAMFGVFDGHGGSEVARFCQKYMAGEITKLHNYHQGRVSDSLVEVFHKMDSMLADERYSQELDQLRKCAPRDQGAPGGEEPSTNDAMNIIRKVLQMRQQATEPGGADKAPAGGSLQQAAGSPSAAMQPLQGTAVVPGPNVAPAPPPAVPPAADPTQETAGESNTLMDTLPDHNLQAGCTAVVAVVLANTLFVANAGDSRAVLCRGRNAVALSHDHKPAHEEERARIMAAGGFVSDIGGVVRVNGNLNLSRAIGDLKYKGNDTLPAKDQIITAQPDIQQITLTPEDRFFVLACDGVWDVMTNQDVVEFVLRQLGEGPGAHPSDIAASLLDACLASNPRDTKGIGCDNMTAIIVCLKPQMPFTDVFHEFDVGARERWGEGDGEILGMKGCVQLWEGTGLLSLSCGRCAARLCLRGTRSVALLGHTQRPRLPRLQAAGHCLHNGTASNSH
ncbi:hypothetical protein WJX73_008581 [Symbiochloris irregularis]|uniref:protein-serine/threonine phosphatase n=1 Tax=Symbiochloris irregularis TaxID=706552 RepID=A0AAW1P1F6_9CHLO